MNLPLKRRPGVGFTKDGPHGMKPGEATPETDPSGGLRRVPSFRARRLLGRDVHGLYVSVGGRTDVLLELACSACRKAFLAGFLALELWLHLYGADLVLLLNV